MEYEIALYGLIVAIISLAVMIILKALPRFSNWPRIQIEYGEERPGSSGNPTSSDELIFKWGATLLLKNSTPHDAYKLKLVQPDNLGDLKIGTLDTECLASGKTTRLPVYVQINVPQDRIRREDGSPREAHKQRFDRLMPDDIKRFTIVLEYKNRHGKRFWTRFVKSGLDDAEGNSAFHKWRRPMP